MQGKTILITGATNGIGKIAAQELAAKGANIVLVARNQEKGMATIKEISAATGNTNLELMLADVSKMNDLRKLSQEFLAKHSRLDVLLNNAGAVFENRQLSQDGFELTLATNHLNYFLLSNLLLEVLQKTASAHGQARIVNVASDAHRSAKINFDDLMGQQKFGGWNAYCQSKLANIMFSAELARRLAGTQVSANSLHPGFVRTGFGDNSGGLMKILLGLGKQLMAISPAQGADTMVHLASSNDVAGISGKYFEKRQVKTPSLAAQDEAAQTRLWEISAKLVGVV